MNYNLISQLVAKGYQGDDIIPILIKNAPHLAKKIKSLITGGWGANEVLEAIQQDPQAKNINLKGAQPSTPEEIAALKVYQGRRSPDRSRDEQALEQLQGFTKKAVQTAGALGSTALGAYALKRALPQAAQALGGMFPNIPGGGPAPISPTGQGPTPIAPGAPPAQPPIQAAPGMQQPQPTAPQPTPTPQSAAQAPTIQQAPSLPPSVPLPEALKKQAEAMLQAGNDTETISGALQSTQPKIVKDYEKATGQPIANAIEEFAKSNVKQDIQPGPSSDMGEPQEESKL